MCNSENPRFGTEQNKDHSVRKPLHYRTSELNFRTDHEPWKQQRAFTHVCESCIDFVKKLRP